MTDEKKDALTIPISPEMREALEKKLSQVVIFGGGGGLPGQDLSSSGCLADATGWYPAHGVVSAPSSPTPEEIDAAARAMCDLGVPADVSIWDQGTIHKKIYYRQLAEAALKAAMAVRRGK